MLNIQRNAYKESKDDHIAELCNEAGTSTSYFQNEHVRECLVALSLSAEGGESLPPGGR